MYGLCYTCFELNQLEASWQTKELDSNFKHSPIPFPALEEKKQPKLAQSRQNVMADKRWEIITHTSKGNLAVTKIWLSSTANI